MSAGEREALLAEAFYLPDHLLYAIDRQGVPYPFTVNCIKKLLDWLSGRSRTFAGAPVGHCALAVWRRQAR